MEEDAIGNSEPRMDQPRRARTEKPEKVVKESRAPGIEVESKDSAKIYREMQRRRQKEIEADKERE